MVQCFLDERKKDLRLDGQGEDEGVQTMHVQCSDIKYVQMCVREKVNNRMYFFYLYVFTYVNI